MAEFVPTIKWSDFLRVQKMGKLQELMSCEVSFNEEYFFSFVNPQTAYVRKHVEYLCQKGNAVPNEITGQRSKTLEQIMEGILAGV